MPGDIDHDVDFIVESGASRGPASRDKVKIALLKQRVRRSPLWMATHGSSMGTTIPDGTHVRIVAHGRPRRGRIYAFVDEGGTLTVHRLRGVSGGRAWLRGDDNEGDDRPVSSEAIVGRVDRIRDVRRATFAVREIRGRLRLDVDSVSRRLSRGRRKD